MSRVMLNVTDIPAEGREFVFEDPGVWTAAWKEFSLPYTMREPLRAELRIVPEKDGFLVRGRIDGVVAVPCSRCAEDALVRIAARFDDFEDKPGEQADPLDGGHLAARGKTLELDAGGLLWEHFELAMPVKPLCAPDCAGLCPVCGGNQNVAGCACKSKTGDPRLAILSNLKIERKK
ncbi:MAG: DUF177 domain-containing protein [Desulfovibrionaceae bacterium]|nr:DUF177 domain-containing protein [Desulfovibrionaceae bacterium]MBF0513253.1 DUF177 domain-containing protein [Desulfovibrionaceae bacterium]